MTSGGFVPGEDWKSIRDRDGDRPGTVTQDARWEIGRRDTGEPAPQIGDEPRPGGNLPVLHSPTIGRSAELASAAQLLSGGSRLLTVIGPGGVGKTRLAVEVATALSPAGGGWFCTLDSVSDPALVPGAIAAALGLTEDGDALQAVAARLSSSPAALVLDNFEQVMGATQVVSTLLSSCPDLKVVVTSQEALRIRGEQELPLGPLTPPGRRASNEELAGNDAVALFTHIARGVRPDFELDEANAAAVSEICRRLDGLPLALELAAARLRMLSPSALLAKMTERLDILESRSRDAQERHRSVHAAVAWSYELLGSDERRALRAFSVFREGASLLAAEQVLGEAAFDLESLVEKSLVQREDTPEGDIRLRMLFTVREFAEGLLFSEGEADLLRDAHAAWFSSRVPAEVPRDEAFGAWLREMDADHDNLQAALGRLLESDPPGALTMATNLGMFWLTRGHLAAGRHWLGRALEAAPEGTARMFASHAAGNLAWAARDLDDAQARYEAALGSGEQRLEMDALNGLGVVAIDRGDLATARGHLERCLELARAAGAPVDQLLGNLAAIAFETGDLPAARDRVAEAFELARQRRDTRTAAMLQTNLGMVTAELGDAQGGYELLLGALAAHRELGDRANEAATLVALARGAPEPLRAGEGAAWAGQALAISRELGDSHGQVDALIARALTGEDSEGDLREAEELARAADYQHGLEEAVSLRGMAG